MAATQTTTQATTVDPEFYTLQYQLMHIFDYKFMRILALILVLLIVHAFIKKIAGRIVAQVVRSHHYTSKLEEHKREQTLNKVFVASSVIILWLMGIVLSLWLLDITLSSIGALLTGAGLLSVVAGLSAQSVIKDYLAGVLIILENQYRIDDIVTLATPVATVSGVVEDISIRITKLRDMDGTLHILNNGSIGVISNQSFQFSNINLDINVTYDTDIALVEKLANEAGAKLAADERFKDAIIEPIQFLRVEALNEANVTVKVFGKVRPGSQWEISGDFRRRLKGLFAKNNIAVAYASTVVKEHSTKK